MEKFPYVTVTAYAKVNIGLNVVGAEDGFHLLETLMIPVDMGERITLQKAEGIAVKYDGGQKYPNDVAVKAAQVICNAYGLDGVDATVTKRIPEGFGLGGSSADAAAMARGLKELYGLQEIDAELLKEIGSDVPFLYRKEPAVARGRGEILTPVKLPKLYLAVLGDKRLKVDTAKAYRLYDEIGGENCEVPGCINGGAKNALEAAALKLEPRIRGSKVELTACGFRNVTMTGSGSAYVAYETEERHFRNCLSRLTAEPPFWLWTGTGEGSDDGKEYVGLSGIPV